MNTIDKTLKKAILFGLAFMLVISLPGSVYWEIGSIGGEGSALEEQSRLPEISSRGTDDSLDFDLDLDKESSQQLIDEKVIAPENDGELAGEGSGVISGLGSEGGLPVSLQETISDIARGFSSSDLERSLRVLPESPTKIKVGITHSRSSQNPSGNIRISGSGRYYLKDSTGRKIKTCSSGSVCSVGKSGSRYYLYYNGSLIKKTEYYPVFKPASGTILSIPSYTGRGYNINGDRRFRGNLIVRYSSYGDQYAPPALWAINQVGLESYVRGIAEEPENTVMRGLKTTAIVARTYGVRNVYYPKSICARRGFHVFNDVKSQVYKGYQYERRAPRLKQAVINTHGLIITYLNRPILAAYHSRCGGYTRSLSGYPYLRGKSCGPYRCSGSRLGHGWGMCMQGMRAKAKAGWSASRIIHYYYTGVSIKKLY